jgi:hypothetical protein
VNDGGGFYFFYSKYGHEKHNSYKNLMSHHLWWFDFFNFRDQRLREGSIPTKERMKAHCKRLKPQFLLNGFTHELIDPNQIICYE